MKFLSWRNLILLPALLSCPSAVTGANEMDGYFSMKPPTWSYGMQSRAASRIGEQPDIVGAVEAAFRAGMTEAVVFA